ncbi:MAG: hypothetical protein VYE15_02285 [Myxococcota bacterium]|nr:hypothetical protein [Myxococcota bacterium]
MDRRLEPHDSNQLELKLAYFMDPEKLSQSYQVEAYMFVPRTLGLTAESYPAERFFEDMAAFVRLKTPGVALSALARDDQATAWFEVVEEGLKRLLSGELGGGERVSRGMKVLGCIYRAALRDEVLRVLNRLQAPLSGEPETRAVDLESRWQVADAFLMDLQSAVGRLRKLGADCEQALVPDDVGEVWSHVDEYVAVVAEDVCTKIVEVLDAVSQAEDTSLMELRERFASEAVSAYHHRRVRDYPSRVQPDEENEGFTHRRRILKRVVSSVLYLNMRKETPSRLGSDVIGMFAAAAAMLFAVMATIWAQREWQFDSTPFVVAAVISYMIKDRIKEWFKVYFGKRLGKKRPGFVRKVRDVQGRVVGRCAENYDVLNPSDLEPELMRLRHLDHPGDVAASGRPEAVLRYMKEVTLDYGKVSEVLSGVSGLNDIIRFNLGRLRRRMDAPYETYRLVNPTSKELTSVRCARVYHVNFILRILSGDKLEVERVRVVVDQRGIKRIEHLTTGSRVDAITEPVADMVELDDLE